MKVVGLASEGVSSSSSTQLGTASDLFLGRSAKKAGESPGIEILRQGGSRHPRPSSPQSRKMHFQKGSRGGRMTLGRTTYFYDWGVQEVISWITNLSRGRRNARSTTGRGKIDTMGGCQNRKGEKQLACRRQKARKEVFQSRRPRLNKLGEAGDVRPCGTPKWEKGGKGEPDKSCSKHSRK